jgi:hypothetical protein
MSADFPDAREIIIGLRGPPPIACDFCFKLTPPEDLHPEEGGDWACVSCLRRWEVADARAEIERAETEREP